MVENKSSSLFTALHVIIYHIFDKLIDNIAIFQNPFGFSRNKLVIKAFAENRTLAKIFPVAWVFILLLVADID